jgi:hypothetical protein
MKRFFAALIAAASIAAFAFPVMAQQQTNAVPPLPPAVISAAPGGTLTLAAAPAAGGLLDVGQAFSASMEPFVNAAVQSALAAGLAWLAWWLRTRFQITVSQAQQQTVQTWLTNQASSLIADGAVSVGSGGKVSVDRQALVQHAQQYAQHIPEAAAFFGLTPEVLAAKIVDKIPQVPAGAQMIAAAPPPNAAQAAVPKA